MFSLWSYLVYFSSNSKIFISTTPLSANFWMYFFLLPCQKKRCKVHKLVVFSCYWQQLTFHFDSCIFKNVWVGMGPVDPVHSCCHKRDYFRQHSRFSFPLCFGKEEPQNGVFLGRTLCRKSRRFGKGQRRVRCWTFRSVGDCPTYSPDASAWTSRMAKHFLFSIQL